MRLTLSWDGDRVVAAGVASARPQAARVLVGQPVERAVGLVPRLFSLCGQAQGVAARLALAAAQGREIDPASLGDAARKVALEAIGEHLWRLLLDWPGLLGLPPRKDEFLGWRKRLLAAQDDAAAAALGRALATWLAGETPLTVDSPSASVPAGFLPFLPAVDWAAQPFDEAFAAQPLHLGQPAETGVLARRQGDPEIQALLAARQGAGARLAARYLDLQFLADALVEPELLSAWLDAAPVAENVGVARVETARGVLLHLIQVNDGTVGGYVIVAPTEWNFHPQGAFVREMSGLRVASAAEAELAARRLALALDPCVAYEVDVKVVANNA